MPDLLPKVSGNLPELKIVYSRSKTAVGLG